MIFTNTNFLSVTSKSGRKYAFKITRGTNGITHTLYDRVPNLLIPIFPKKLYEIENALEANDDVTDYDIGVYVAGEYEFWNKIK